MLPRNSSNYLNKDKKKTETTQNKILIPHQPVYGRRKFFHYSARKNKNNPMRKLSPASFQGESSYVCHIWVAEMFLPECTFRYSSAIWQKSFPCFDFQESLISSSSRSGVRRTIMPKIDNAATTLPVRFLTGAEIQKAYSQRSSLLIEKSFSRIFSISFFKVFSLVMVCFV